MTGGNVAGVGRPPQPRSGEPAKRVVGAPRTLEVPTGLAGRGVHRIDRAAADVRTPTFATSSRLASPAPTGRRISTPSPFPAIPFRATWRSLQCLRNTSAPKERGVPDSRQGGGARCVDGAPRDDQPGGSLR